jgi:anti-sigma B factor antagonist
MDLGMNTSERDGWTVLSLSGEIDIATAPRVRERLYALLAEGKEKLVVDLDDVGFLDSTGLGVLVGVLKRVRTQGGELRLVCTQPRIVKVFEITRLDSAFAIFDSIDGAVRDGSPS